MIRFYLKKLVRDKVIDKCLSDPEVLHSSYRTLDDEAFRFELRRKLHEEADEIPLDNTDRAAVLEELADTQEVLDALRQSFGYSEEELRQAMEQKRRDKGGFTKRHYIEYHDLADDSQWVALFRAQPEKYREERACELPLFITGNQHKADYLSQLLDIPLQHQKLSLDEIQSTSLEEIVEHKVRQAYEAVKQPVLVEDVALSFEALGGLPGPFVKFFVEAPNGLESLCRILDGFDDRTATASCVFGYYDGREVALFRGGMPGSIADSPRGDGGYGWDKIFCPDGYGGRTRAELNKEEDYATYVATKPIAELRAFLQNRV